MNKYSQKAGFKFSLDGIHNCPKSSAYIGVFCLNPPGAFYGENQDLSKVHLNSVMDWERFYYINNEIYFNFIFH